MVHLLFLYPTLTVSEKEITSCVPVLASVSVKEYNPTSTLSVAPAAVTLHIPLMVLVSPEGKSRAPEVRLLGPAMDKPLSLSGSVFLSIKWALTDSHRILLNELSTQYSVWYMVKCSKRYSFHKYLLNAYCLPGCVPECHYEVLKSKQAS